MLEQKQASSFADQIAEIIERDKEFKLYHQTQGHKGLLKFIKYSFQEMVELLKKVGAKPSNKNEASIEERYKSRVKIWSYHQYKIFVWISLWFITKHQLLLNNIFQVDLSVFKQLFREKEDTFLRYELFLIISKVQSYELRWTFREDKFLKAKITRWASQSEEETNWRFISFQMFTEKAYKKTPNQCRQRWLNHLNPNLKKSKWNSEEDYQLLNLYQEYGPKWSMISKLIRNRNEHMVKNRFFSLKKKWMTKTKCLRPFNLKSLIRSIKIQKSFVDSNSHQLVEESQQPISENQSQAEFQQIIEVEAKELLMVKPSEGSPVRQIQGQEATLFLIDIEEGYFKQPQIKQEKKEATQQLNQFLQISQLLNDPLLKLNDRIQTSDYEWLDNMIEQRNLSWLSQDD